MGKVALLTLHGMGDTGENFHSELSSGLRHYVKKQGKNWDDVIFRPVYYQPLVQKNQELRFAAIKQENAGKLDALKLRQFFLYSFSDATSLEYKRQEENSPYHHTQSLIAKILGEIYDEHGAIPVIIHAQSLGCQVISNYIWDAQQAKPSGGVFLHGGEQGSLPAETSEKGRFLRFNTLRRLVTTGCNIPIFTAGHDHIKTFSPVKLGTEFRWVNLYDKDDVLGWPLRQLSTEHRELVEDKEINASSSFFGTVAKSWNFLCHGEYWGDNDVIREIGEELKRY